MPTELAKHITKTEKLIAHLESRINHIINERDQLKVALAWIERQESGCPDCDDLRMTARDALGITK